jgi:hypothetical protein
MMRTKSLPKVLIYVRCPCCNLWRYLGKYESLDHIDYTLKSGFDVPFEIDYRVGGGRAYGWRSKIRRKRLPKSMKENYGKFLITIKHSRDILKPILEAS